MRSISESFSAGITGATITVVGMPASDNCRSASSRFGGVEARGSMVRASFGSSVVTESATLARLRFAIRARMSISRVTSADLVTMPTGMPCPLQHFENAAHDLPLALDRLIGIGVGADRDHARLVIRRRQFLFQQRRRVGLGEQLGFEIEPRRQAEEGVGRPRETVDAAVLAAPVGIDRAVEADIGRVVAGDDLARGVERDRGLERRQFVEALPAVVEGDARFGLETAAGVGLRAAAAPPFALDRNRQFRKRGSCTRRLGGRRDRRVLEGM